MRPPPHTRASPQVSRISLADKYQALGTGTPYLASIGMPAYQWCVGVWVCVGGGDASVSFLLSLLTPPAAAVLPPRRWSEATHGVTGPGVHYGGALPGATNTGLPITTSCSFNRSLWKATGNLIGREGRAFSNAGQAGLTFWTCVR